LLPWGCFPTRGRQLRRRGYPGLFQGRHGGGWPRGGVAAEALPGAECGISSRLSGQHRLACPGGRPFLGATGLPALEKRGHLGPSSRWFGLPALEEGGSPRPPSRLPALEKEVLLALEERGLSPTARSDGWLARLPWRRRGVVVAMPHGCVACPGEEVGVLACPGGGGGSPRPSRLPALEKRSCLPWRKGPHHDRQVDGWPAWLACPGEERGGGGHAMTASPALEKKDLACPGGEALPR
jgi:hypothetical protein